MVIVEETLSRFHEDLEHAYGGRLVDVVIHGSYVLGDFAPHRGDLDFVVLFQSDMRDAEVTRFLRLFDEYRSSKALLLHQLEGTAYPSRAVADPRAKLVGCYVGTTRSGWRKVESFQNSWIDLRLIGERGRSLAGRRIDVYEPSEDEILAEQIGSLRHLEKALASPAGASIGLFYAVVHWCARTIVYRSTRRISSKSQACESCFDGMAPRRFAELFRLAKRQRHPYPSEAVDPALRRAVDGLLEFVGERLGVLQRLPLPRDRRRAGGAGARPFSESRTLRTLDPDHRPKSE